MFYVYDNELENDDYNNIISRIINESDSYINCTISISDIVLPENSINCKIEILNLCISDVNKLYKIISNSTNLSVLELKNRCESFVSNKIIIDNIILGKCENSSISILNTGSAESTCLLTELNKHFKKKEIKEIIKNDLIIPDRFYIM